MRIGALIAVLAAALLLAGCSVNPPGYRYKLTLEVETPEGIARGYSVVEVTHHNVSIPARGTMTRCRGEGIYLDLGPNLRPLVAMLTRVPESADVRSEVKSWSRNWGGCAPFDILARLYGEKFKDYGTEGTNIRKLVRHRGAREVNPASGNLPGLVTFGNLNLPESVMVVDPGNLAATLGPGVRWHKITLEITDEDVTSGIEKKLPWLDGFKGSLAHPGQSGGVRTSNHLPATLGLFNFKQRGH